jgi:hypothetical protein
VVEEDVIEEYQDRFPKSKRQKDPVFEVQVHHLLFLSDPCHCYAIEDDEDQAYSPANVLDEANLKILALIELCQERLSLIFDLN